MVIVSLLHHAEFGRNDYRKDAPHLKSRERPGNFTLQSFETLFLKITEILWQFFFLILFNRFFVVILDFLRKDMVGTRNLESYTYVLVHI